MNIYFITGTSYHKIWGLYTRSEFSKHENILFATCL